MDTAHLHIKTMKHFNERQRRIYAGSLAKQYGYGGITLVHHQTGMDVHTIARGIQELDEEPMLERIRKPGAGRKRLEDKTPQLIPALELEANPKTDKRTIVKWTSHSMEHIAEGD